MALDQSQNDATWKTRVKKFLKNQKARFERRKAKRDPEAKDTYKKYRGYWS